MMHKRFLIALPFLKIQSFGHLDVLGMVNYHILVQYLYEEGVMNI